MDKKSFLFYILLLIFTLQGFNQNEKINAIFRENGLTDSLKIDSVFILIKDFSLEEIALFDSLLYEKFKHSENRLFQIGTSFADNTIYDRALKYFNFTENLAIRNNNYSIIVKTKNKKAQILRRQGNHDFAIRILEDNIELIKKHDINQELSFALHSLGLTYRDNNKLNSAEKYFRDALHTSNRYSSGKFNHTIIHELGNIHGLKGNFDSALIYQSEALELRKKHNSTFNLLISYNDMGDVYLRANQITNALKMFKKAEELAVETNNLWALATILLNIGDAFYQQKKYKQAINSTLKSLQLCRKYDYQLAQKYATQLISNIYRHQAKYDSALLYQDSLVILNAAIQTEKTNTLLEELNAKYESAKKDQELYKQRAKISQQRIMLIVTVGGLVVLALLMFLIVRLLLRIRHAYAVLKVQKEEIGMKNIRLEEMNNEKNSLMRIVAHDLKSPLNNIYSILGLLSDDEIQYEEQQKYFSMIYKIIADGNALIQDLIDLHIYEDTGMQIEFKETDIIEVVEEAVIAHDQTALKKNIIIHLENNIEHIEIKTDGFMLKRILDNLISNGIKFSMPEKNIYVSVQMINEALQISVKDEGPGFTDDDKKKVFQKFQKLSARPTGQENSSGLGLSIVKILIERLGGTITLKSEKGEGSEFVVSLPTSGL
jgi:signal transduction histidine kinase